MACASPSAKSPPADVMRFRSVLPHEPLPIEDLGYVHIQGSFTPKLIGAKTKNGRAPEENCEDQQTVGDGKWMDSTETSEGTLSNSDHVAKSKSSGNGAETDDESPIQTDSALLEHFGVVPTIDALLSSLVVESSFDSPKSTACDTKMDWKRKLPHSVRSVEVATPNADATLPPLTKFRLVYDNPYVARDMVSFFRSHRISPRDLLADCMLQQVTSTDDMVVQFSTRPLQATPVTLTKLPDFSWDRSNPPKFRRLIARRMVSGEDTQDGDALLSNNQTAVETEEEMNLLRSTTRYVFVSNLIFDEVFDMDVLSEVRDTEVEAAKGNSTSMTSSVDDLDPNYVMDAVRQMFSAFDSTVLGVEVFLLSKKTRSPYKSCHVGMRCHQDAAKVIESLQGQRMELTIATRNDSGEPSVVKVSTGDLFLDYADITHRSYKKGTKQISTTDGSIATVAAGGLPSRPECTSATESVVVPGLVLIEDYVSEDHEEILLAALEGPHAPWAPSQQTPSGGAVKRRVQHYGYVFDYETADVLRDRSTVSGGCPPLPGLPTSKKEESTEPLSTSCETEVGFQYALGTARSSASCLPEAKLTEFIDRSSADLDGWTLLAGILERTRRFDFSPHLCREAVGGTTERFQNSHGETRGEGGKEMKFSHATKPGLPDPYSQSAVFPNLNQLTVNEYKPGEGIGSHIDTPSAFDDGLISLSLGGGIVMEFRWRQCDSESAQGEKKLVYLPPRSLLLMSGPARYAWEHMIVSRMTDTVNGSVLPRTLRVSLTMRTALQLKAATMTDVPSNQASPQPMPIVESSDFPLSWSSNQVGTRTPTSGHTNDIETSSQQLPDYATPETERRHVHDVYDAVAKQWHHTRGRRGVLWPGATQFLSALPSGSVVADVGCGDGKYFPAIWAGGSFVIGTDISLPLLRTSVGAVTSRSNREGQGDDSGENGKAAATPDSRRVDESKIGLDARPALAVADCMSIPLRSESMDAVICIAVMHHLSTVPRRIRCLAELARIVRAGGLINVQAWALEQEEGSRRKFAGADVFVPFNAQPRYLERTTLLPSEEHDKVVPKAAATSNRAKTEVTSKATESKDNEEDSGNKNKGVAQMVAESYGAEFNESKGLVVFQRYCHLYRKGELEELVATHVPSLRLVESGFEAGNHFMILEKVRDGPKI